MDEVDPSLGHRARVMVDYDTASNRLRSSGVAWLEKRWSKEAPSERVLRGKA